MNREIVAKKREEIRKQIRETRSGPKMDTSDKVEATVSLATNIRSLFIPVGTRGIIVSVFQWVDGYDVEFKIHDTPLVVPCMSNQIKRIGK